MRAEQTISRRANQRELGGWFRVSCILGRVLIKGQSEILGKDNAAVLFYIGLCK